MSRCCLRTARCMKGPTASWCCVCCTGSRLCFAWSVSYSSCDALAHSPDTCSTDCERRCRRTSDATRSTASISISHTLQIGSWSWPHRLLGSTHLIATTSTSSHAFWRSATTDASSYSTSATRTFPRMAWQETTTPRCSSIRCADLSASASTSVYGFSEALLFCHKRRSSVCHSRTMAPHCSRR